MKVQGIRVADRFRPFGIRIIFENYGEANSWWVFLLKSNQDVVGVRETMEQMADQMDFLNDEGEDL